MNSYTFSTFLKMYKNCYVKKLGFLFVNLFPNDFKTKDERRRLISLHFYQKTKILVNLK